MTRPVQASTQNSMPREGRRENGIVHVSSNCSVPESLERLQSVVKSRGLTVFARIDFIGDAAKAGLRMRPPQVLIFGNPKAGTPLPMCGKMVSGCGSSLALVLVTK